MIEVIYHEKFINKYSTIDIDKQFAPILHHHYKEIENKLIFFFHLSE